MLIAVQRRKRWVLLVADLFDRPTLGFLVIGWNNHCMDMRGGFIEVCGNMDCVLAEFLLEPFDTFTDPGVQPLSVVFPALVWTTGAKILRRS